MCFCYSYAAHTQVVLYGDSINKALCAHRYSCIAMNPLYCTAVVSDRLALSKARQSPASSSHALPWNPDELTCQYIVCRSYLSAVAYPSLHELLPPNHFVMVRIRRRQSVVAPMLDPPRMR